MENLNYENIVKSVEAKTRIALKRIKNHVDYGCHVGHSGGKDSNVVWHLAKSLFPDIMVIHNTKPLYFDKPSGKTDVHTMTLQYLYEYVIPNSHTVLFVESKKMEQVVYDLGLECQIDGSRADEYTRSGKSSTFVVDGVNVERSNMTEYVEEGLFLMSFCYPIFDWTSNDVFNYHLVNNIPLSREYLSDEEYIIWQEQTGKDILWRR